jgi:two-component system, OmpR family, response regulator
MRTVLLVDDDECLIWLFARFFEDGGCGVLTAPGGRECLALLEHKCPDLILLDIMMQPMDGWETLLHIKENSRWAKIPVAMLTGKTLSQKEFDMYAMLFEHYLLKPLSEKKMISLSVQIIDDCNKVNGVAEAARNKGMDASIIDEYLLLQHRVMLNQRMSADLMLYDISISWDAEKDEERLMELEKMFADR